MTVTSQPDARQLRPGARSVRRSSAAALATWSSASSSRQLVALSGDAHAGRPRRPGRSRSGTSTAPRRRRSATTLPSSLGRTVTSGRAERARHARDGARCIARVEELDRARRLQSRRSSARRGRAWLGGSVRRGRGRGAARSSDLLGSGAVLGDGLASRGGRDRRRRASRRPRSGRPLGAVAAAAGRVARGALADPALVGGPRGAQLAHQPARRRRPGRSRPARRAAACARRRRRRPPRARCGSSLRVMTARRGYQRPATAEARAGVGRRSATRARRRTRPAPRPRPSARGAPGTSS